MNDIEITNFIMYSESYIHIQYITWKDNTTYHATLPALTNDHIQMQKMIREYLDKQPPKTALLNINFISTKPINQEVIRQTAKSILKGTTINIETNRKWIYRNQYE